MKLKQKNLIRRNFTMVELLTVCAIIAILAGIGAGGYALAQTKIKVSRTQALIKRIETALEACKTKHGFYPQNEKKSYLLLNLGLDTSKDSQEKYLEDYQRLVEYENLKKSAKEINGEWVILDAWGYPIYYATPGETNTGSFDLLSAGADGQVGNTGVKLWTAEAFNTSTTPNLKASKTDRQKADTKNSDDLANF